jgi:SAM-dependent methyltransferase
MAHAEQLQFVKSVLFFTTPSFKQKKVIEIGSYDVNGTVRNLFSGTEYFGVDLVEGPGVDLVCEGGKVDYESNTFDISISCECFEHNPYWVATFSNMHRLTKEGGLVMITVATTGREEHGTLRTSPVASPGTQSLKWDYYKNLTEQDFHNQSEMKKMYENYLFISNNFSCDLYFLGIKKCSSSTSNLDVAQLKEICLQDQKDLRNLIYQTKQYEKYTPKFLRKIIRKIHRIVKINNRNPRLIYF